MPNDTRMTPAAQGALARRLGLNYTPPKPSAAPPVPKNYQPTKLFPEGAEVAMQKEQGRMVSKIGAKRVFEMQEDIRRRFGDPKTRDIDGLSGPYLRTLARQIAANHGLDSIQAIRAAEEIIKDALT